MFYFKTFSKTLFYHNWVFNYLLHFEVPITLLWRIIFTRGIIFPSLRFIDESYHPNWWEFEGWTLTIGTKRYLWWELRVVWRACQQHWRACPLSSVVHIIIYTGVSCNQGKYHFSHFSLVYYCKLKCGPFFGEFLGILPHIDVIWPYFKYRLANIEQWAIIIVYLYFLVIN